MATSIRLDANTESRLNQLATETGRSKAFYLREIIANGLDDLEDYYLAAETLERVRSGKEKTYSAANVRNELNMER